MKKIQIAPSILSANFSKMGEEVRSMEECGADVIHYDVMDGVFVNNITFGLKMLEDIRPHTTLPIDAHLMIVHPEKYVERFAKAGADIITVHWEACQDNLKEVLELIKSTGVKCGAVINPDTPVEKIKDVIPLCDMVLVMSVFLALAGRSLSPRRLINCVKFGRLLMQAARTLTWKWTVELPPKTCVMRWKQARTSSLQAARYSKRLTAQR